MPRVSIHVGAPAMIQFNRRQVTVAGGLALLVTFRQQALHAQTCYPEQRIRVILPSAAGGVGDSVIRLLASGMERTLGQKLVIEVETRSSRQHWNAGSRTG